MYYFVVNIYKGNYSVQGTYKTPDAARARADIVQGGQTHVFGPLETPDPKEAISKFREEELRGLS